MVVGGVVVVVAVGSILGETRGLPALEDGLFAESTALSSRAAELEVDVPRSVVPSPSPAGGGSPADLAAAYAASHRQQQIQQLQLQMLMLMQHYPIQNLVMFQPHVGA